MNHGQGEGRIPLLLADRRVDGHQAEPHLQLDLSSADAADRRTSTSCVPRIGSRSIFLEIVVLPAPATRSTQVRTRKWCVPLLGRAKQFVDVAFAVANMHAASRIDKRRRLLQVLQPAKTLFLFDGDPSRIDRVPAPVNAAPLEGIGSFELLARPELDGRQAQGFA